MTQKSAYIGTVGYIKNLLINSNPNIYNETNFKPGIIAPIHFPYKNILKDADTNEIQHADLYANSNTERLVKFWNLFSNDYIDLSQRDLEVEITINVNTLTKITDNVYAGYHLRFIGDDNKRRYIVLVFNRTIPGMHAWCGTGWEGEEFTNYGYNKCSASGEYKLWISHKKDSDFITGGHSKKDVTERFKLPVSKYSLKKCLLQLTMSNYKNQIVPISIKGVKVKYGNDYIYNGEEV